MRKILLGLIVKSILRVYLWHTCFESSDWLYVFKSIPCIVFLRNGLTPAPFWIFVLLKRYFTEKTAEFSGIRNGTTRVEGEHADHQNCPGDSHTFPSVSIWDFPWRIQCRLTSSWYNATSWRKSRRFPRPRRCPRPRRKCWCTGERSSTGEKR